MACGNLQQLVLVFFFLIHADPFASLPVNKTTPAVNVSQCTDYNCSTMSALQGGVRISGLNIFLANLAGIICCVAIVKNCIVLFSFKKDSLLRLPQNYFFISLTVADLITALVSMPVFTQYVLLGRWVLSVNICDAWMTVDWTLRLGSLYLRVLITVDKFFTVKYPTRYMVWRSPLKAKVAICSACLIPAVVIFIYVFAVKDSDNSNAEICEMPFMEYKTTAFYLSILYFWIPLLVIGSLYCSLYATSYATYKRYERLRRSWNLKNKKNVKLRKAGRKEKYSTKECKPLSDSNTVETIDLRRFDVVTPSSTDRDIFDGDVSQSQCVSIDQQSSDPSVNLHTTLASCSSPIIKITSPVESERKLNDRKMDDDVISSDEEFMQRLYNSTQRYPVDDVQGSREFTGISFLETKNGSKDINIRTRRLTSLDDSSDSDSDDIYIPQSSMSYCETTLKQPGSHPKQHFTKLPGPSRKTEYTYEDSRDEKHCDYVIAAYSGKTLQHKENSTCNVLHIKSYSGEESAKATVYSVKSQKQCAILRKLQDDEDNFNISIDAGQRKGMSKTNNERQQINEYLQSAEAVSHNTRNDRDFRKTKLGVAQSSVRPFSDIKRIQRNKGTNDKCSSQHIDNPNFKEVEMRKIDHLQKKLPASSTPSQSLKTYNLKDSKLNKKSSSNVECDRNEIPLKFVPRCKTSSVNFKSDSVRPGKNKSKRKSFQFEPKYSPKTRDQVAKLCEHSESSLSATALPSDGRNIVVQTGSKQSSAVMTNEDNALLDTTTFFQQLRNTMRTSMEALSFSSAYFDSVNRALNTLPEDQLEDASIQTCIDKEKTIRPYIRDPNFQQTASTSRCTLSNINRTCRGGAQTVARNDVINTCSLNREESIRSRAQVKTNYTTEMFSDYEKNPQKNPQTSKDKTEMFSDNEKNPQTSFSFETNTGLAGPSYKLKNASKCSKKENKKAQKSILKARSFRDRNTYEFGSGLDPTQTIITQKPQRTFEVKNNKAVSSSLERNEVTRCEPEIDKKPIKSIYLDKISWASYLSQRRQTQDGEVTWDKSSSDEDNVGNPVRNDVTPQEDNCLQSVTFEKMPAQVVEPCVVIKKIEFDEEKEAAAKTSTPMERSTTLHDSSMLPVIPHRAIARRNLDRHPIYLYGVGNRWNGQIQLDTQSMKTAFQEIAAISSLVCVLFLCWLPLHVLIFADAFCQANADALWYHVTTWLIYMNSMLNPFCYNFVNAGFLEMWQHLVRACKA